MANMRYVKYAIVTVLFASLISIAPSISYSQLVETTVEVDKSSYSTGETVSIGGIVPKAADGVPVAVTLSLSFQETELVMAEDVFKKGY